MRGEVGRKERGTIDEESAWGGVGRGGGGEGGSWWVKEVKEG